MKVVVLGLPMTLASLPSLVPEDERVAIGPRARERVLAGQPSAQRAAELERYVAAL